MKGWAKTTFALGKTINRNMVILHIIIANKSRFKKLKNRRTAKAVSACCHCFCLKGFVVFYKLN